MCASDTEVTNNFQHKNYIRLQYNFYIFQIMMKLSIYKWAPIMCLCYDIETIQGLYWCKNLCFYPNHVEQAPFCKSYFEISDFFVNIVSGPQFSR